MKLARRGIDDPDRMVELEASFDEYVTELLAQANDAGYSADEALAALASVCRHQSYANGQDPDPADDPDTAES